MKERYPRIRRYSELGNLAFREGLHLCFFMQRSHGEVAPAVRRALDTYLATVGHEKLGSYVDMEGEFQQLDGEGWEFVNHRLLGNPEAQSCYLQLDEFSTHVGGFHFEYRGRKLGTLHASHWPGLVSGVSFWLPTEYLEEHGPGQVRALAIALARELPFNSGYVSLAFNHLDMLGSTYLVHDLCFQYPGLDVHDLSCTIMSVGTKVRSAYWLNFYGQPLLGQLGGPERLRARLPFPEVLIQQLEGEKLLVSLEDWPSVGASPGEEMRPYRALSRLLEPYLSEEVIRWHAFPPEELRRWQRRFLE
jgi:hypothetical protein